jgi:fucose permease
MSAVHLHHFQVSGSINCICLIFVSDCTCYKSESPNAIFIKIIISGRFTQSRQCNRSHRKLYYTFVTINLYKETRGCSLTSTYVVVLAAAVVIVINTFNCCIPPCCITIIITTIIPLQHNLFS